MVASRSHDLYAPFPHPFAVEDGAQSSEDGSGLHSPTFHDRDSHKQDFRPTPPSIDINNVAGLLASHFSPTHTVPVFSSDPYPQPVPDVVSHYSYIQPHRDYDYTQEPEYYISRTPRGHYTPSIHSNVRPPTPPPPQHAVRATAHTFSAGDAPRPLALPTLLPAGTGVSESRVHIAGDEEPRVAAASSSHDDSVSPSTSRASPAAGRNPPARREASLVVIACRQCRARKIRCDSTRPACNNCLRRSNECQYDAVPKRRGPDKRPGTRQRSCKKRPVDGSLPPKKRQRTDTEDPGAASDGEPASGVRAGGTLRLDTNFTARASEAPQSAGYSATPADDMGAAPFQFPLTANTPTVASATTPPSVGLSLHAPIPRIASPPELALTKASVRHGPFSVYEDFSSDPLPDSDGSKPFASPLVPHSHPADHRLQIAPTPSVNFTRKVWWEDLLNKYSTSRQASQRAITADLSFLFSTSSYWLFFIHKEMFFRTLWDDAEREHLQPALVLAGLALATLMKSSELGHGSTGRHRALWLRDAAQACLEASWNASAVDTTLAEAAMILALFESSAHPAHTADRACSALLFLDQIIRALALTSIDAGDPSATVYSAAAVPVAPTPPPVRASGGGADAPCGCAPPMYLPSLGHEPEGAWATAPGWDPRWTVAEVRKEETRRLCWCALSLAAAHTAHCAAFDREPLDLFLIQPEHYALLFPDEKLREADGAPRHPPKQSIWALYCRSMLLWNGCLHLRKNTGGDGEKAEFAMQAWLETQEIQDAIDAHVCAVDTHLLYMAREYLFNTRMAITYEFRRLQDLDSGNGPMFSRRQAEDWLYYQSQTAKRFHVNLRNGRDPQAHVLTRRPFYVWWFMSQLAISMSLWAYDNSLLEALQLSQAFLIPLDFLSALWPCQAQRDRYLELRDELAENCAKAGLPRPPPPDFTLSSPIRHM